MTTGTNRDPRPWQRHWAEEQLELAPDSPALDSRRALLRKLADEEFVPPPEWRKAHDLLSGRPAPEGADPLEFMQTAAREEEEWRRAEVEAFATHFWELEPDERRRQWVALAGACVDFPRLAARLRALEPGLAVAAVLPLEPNTAVQALHAQVLELFILRPAEQAVRRQEILWRVRLQGQAREWEAAARQLRKAHPRTVALQPGFIHSLASWTERQKHLVKMRRALRRARSTSPQSGKGGGKNRGWWIVGIIIFALLRGLGSSGTNSSSSSSRNSPRYFDQSRDTTPLFQPPRQVDPELWKGLAGPKPGQDPRSLREPADNLERWLQSQGVEAKIHRGSGPLVPVKPPQGKGASQPSPAPPAGRGKPPP